MDRTGEIVEQGGIDLRNYRQNPVVLWQHDTRTPIARATEIGVSGGKLSARVRWPPPGISAKADEIRGLVKAGIISAVSIGFNPIQTIPLDKSNPKKGPQKYVRCELGEFSFVSVPANPNALVVQRALAGIQDQRGGDTPEAKAKRLRDLDLIKVALAPRHRSDRMRELRELDLAHLARMAP
ncbi:HK97 family phage prohead protease [Tardiphaga sp.]|uniref:HK97 family phage prohead protease n=1 Tax=Tardiphaga sp. TaxID=1926292 RepID=UPI00352A103B